MMHFYEAARDGAFLAELREFGLLTPDVMERIDAALNRPETGTLNEFLLAGAEFVSEPDWLTWLIRQHGCHRFGRAGWRGPVAAGPGAEGNQPFRRVWDGSVLVAVLRPDRWAETEGRMAGFRLHRAAATLRELRALHVSWRLGGCDSGTSSEIGCLPSW